MHYNVTQPLLKEVSAQWQSKPTSTCNRMVARHNDRLDIKQRKKMFFLKYMQSISLRIF